MSQTPSQPPADKVLVDKKALHAVLQALVGAPHLIRELQATRNLPPLNLGDGEPYQNPINVLIEDFNKHTT